MMTYGWKERSIGKLTNQIDWKNWISDPSKAIDPYLVWADISGTSALLSPANEGDLEAAKRWPFIIELSEKDLCTFSSGSSTEVPVVFSVLDIPASYQSIDADVSPLGSRWKIKGHYITALVDPYDIEHILSSRIIRRAQLGLPRIRQVQSTPAPETPLNVQRSQSRVVVGIIDDGFGFGHDQLLDGAGKPRVLYLWDQDRQRERLLGTQWVKPDDLGYGGELGPKQIEAAVLKVRDSSDALGSANRDVAYGPYRLDPMAYYSAPQDADGSELPSRSMLSSSHGQSVVDLAAGYPPIHREQSYPVPPSLATNPRSPTTARANIISALSRKENHPNSLDSADQWPLILVQLPVRTVVDTSGGSLAVHVLDGIRYILERARRIPPFFGPDTVRPDVKFEDNPVVINISYGALGGGHDGTSILEEAIGELVTTAPNNQSAWVVLAAGNANEGSTHTQVDMAPGDDRELIWRVGPDNPLESFLEIWLPDRDIFGELLYPGVPQELTVKVRSPLGHELHYAGCGQVWQLHSENASDDALPVAALIYAQRVAQSKHGTMILLAVVPTRNSSGATVPMLHGDWRLELHWPQTAGTTICVHAWTERNDLLFGVPRGQQSRVFADEPVGETSEFDPEARSAWKQAQINPASVRGPHGVYPRFGLSTFAGAKPARPKFSLPQNRLGEVVVVGSLRAGDGEVSRSSSGGPSRLIKRKDEIDVTASQWNKQRNDGQRIRPDVMAPGDLSPAVPGIRTNRITSSGYSRISATSAAAALVTRAIANVQYVFSLRTGGLLEDLPEEGRNLAQIAEKQLFEAASPSDDIDLDSRRGTLTPRIDDAFRRATYRIR